MISALRQDNLSNWKARRSFNCLGDIGLNPGEETGFDLSKPEIPKEAVDQIVKVEVKANGFNF